MKKCHAKKNIFGKVTVYQTWPFCMAFVFSIVVFFIDHYYAGGYLISIVYFPSFFICFVLRFYGPVNTIKVMSSWSVNLSSLVRERLIDYNR